MRRAGFVLVLVSVFLTMLLMIASLLVFLSRLERSTAGNALDSARAQMLARSGVEYAMARLTTDPVARPGTGTQRDDWTYREANLPAPASVSLERAHNPSWAHGEPYTVDAVTSHNGRFDPGMDVFTRALHDRNGNGVHDGWTGRLRGAYAPYGDTFSLRVEDESAKINVNGGFLDTIDRDGDPAPGVLDHRDVAVGPLLATSTQTGRGWNAQLRRILDILGDVSEGDWNGNAAVDPFEDWNRNGVYDPPPVGIADLGRKVIEGRPPGGYRTVEEVEDEVGAPRGRLSPYLTVSSWVDRKVLRPNGYDTQATQQSVSELKRARAPLAWEEGGRPPVNLNVAPRPVLVSLLQGLRAPCWHDESNAAPVYEISPLMAHRVAASLEAFRSGLDPDGWFAAAGLAPRAFRSWGEFEAFCDALVGVNGAGVGKPLSGFAGAPPWYGPGNLPFASLLCANFDPNTMLNKQVPDQLVYRWIDKSDLSVYSTEGCFDLSGRVLAASVGRVRGSDGSEAAWVGIRTSLELYVPWRQTTQEDFVSGRGSGEYLSMQGLIGLGNPPTTGANANWNSWGAGRGLAVLTYPCAPPALPIHAFPYDGSIALATVELERAAVEAYGGAGSLRFLHHFDDSWDADESALGDAALRAAPGGNGARLQPFAATRVAESVWPASTAEPSTFYPDGVHPQYQRAPAYLAGHLPENGRHGTLGFWVKDTIRGAWEEGNNPTLCFTCVRYAGVLTQVLMVGRSHKYAVWGIIAENMTTPSDRTADNLGSYERRYDCTQDRGQQWAGSRLLPGLRWRFVTAHWDTDETVLGTDVHLHAAGLRPDLYENLVAGYGALVGDGEDLHGNTMGEVFVLGGQRSLYTYLSWFGRYLIDEFAICDFGDNGAVAWNDRGSKWMDDVYQAGRYYKGNDGEFTSASLRDPSGAPVTVVTASWTSYLPREGRLELRWPYSPIAPPQNSVQREPDLSLAQSRMEVQLLEPDGTVRTLAPGERVGRTLQSFRYRVRFLPTPTWTDSYRDHHPVLETPVFEDITFFCSGASGARILSWGD